MPTLTPQSFLNHLSGGLASCEFFGSLDRDVLGHCLDRLQNPQTFDEMAHVVRDCSFSLACNFLGRIQGPMTARLFGPERLGEPLAPTLAGGRPLCEGVFLHDEFVIEASCESSAFRRPDSGLPMPGNWEIALREIEEGLGRIGHLVLLGGVRAGGNPSRRWDPSEDRTMIFRLPSPGLVMGELRLRRPEAELDPVYAPGLVSFRDYEESLSRKSWPVGLPLDLQPVDEEGPQHPLYFLYHELGHAALRSLRKQDVRDAGRALLRAGLAVFPEVDGVSPQSGRGQILARFFSRMIDLKEVYLMEHVAGVLEQTVDAYLFGGPEKSGASLCLQFLAEAEGALRVASLPHPDRGDRWDPLWAAVGGCEKNARKHLAFFGSFR